MKEKKPVKIIYYNDELKDEFSGIVRKTKVVDENFKYEKNFLWKFAAVLLYRLLAVPAAFLYTKLKFGLKIENKKILKDFKKSGYFLYGNHTQVPGDGFMQGLVSYPKKNYVLVNADNISLKGTQNLMMMLGAMPIPTTRKGYKHFLDTLMKRCRKGNCVTVFPEAHVWPYYTGIRKFTHASFNYPVLANKPIFCFTVVYKKSKFRKAKIIIKLDGPFFPEINLPLMEAQTKLRDKVYETMAYRAMESDFEYIKYIKIKN